MLSSNLSKIFSSHNINLISEGDFSLVKNVVECYQDNFDKTVTIGNIFDFCHNLLHKQYRNEYFYKNTIARKILIGRHSINTTTMFTEFRVGANKADCVIVNDIAICYEIKTDYDNLSRLESQINSYLKIFDKVNIVISEKHLNSVLDISPNEVGIIVLSKKGTLREFRPAHLIQLPIDTGILIRSLRKEEYVGLVKALFGFTPEVSNTEIFRECERLLTLADKQKVRKEFRKIIKKTRSLDKKFISSLPMSLIVAGLEFDLTAHEKLCLLRNISSTLDKEVVCTTQFLKVNSLN